MNALTYFKFVLTMPLFISLPFLSYAGSNVNNIPPKTKNFTLSEISQHNKKTDCWLIIDSQVYDVTAYIAAGTHPTKHDLISEHCGQDATDVYQQKGKKMRPHSGYANELLKQYLIGSLAPTVKEPTKK